jgi:hypothetical protein
MAKSYRTMRGKEVDMDALLERNQLMPAVGNVKMNARGDELGPGGKIVRKREDIVNAYYENNPMAKKSGPVKTKVDKAPVMDTQPVMKNSGAGTEVKMTIPTKKTKATDETNGQSDTIA